MFDESNAEEFDENECECQYDEDDDEVDECGYCQSARFNGEMELEDILLDSEYEEHYQTLFAIKCLLLTIAELEPFLSKNSKNSRDAEFLQSQTTLGKWSKTLSCAKETLSNYLGKDIINIVVNFCLLEECWLSDFIVTF
jgi:hypothetical protein